MKKKIIICVFLALILITSVLVIIAAVDSYNYDMDPENGVDKFRGFGAVLTVILGAFVVFYEIDLFYTIFYFFVKPKTLKKSILVILSNLSLLLIFFTDNIVSFCRRYFSIILESGLEGGIIPIGLFLIYALLKLICLTIDCFANED